MENLRIADIKVYEAMNQNYGSVEQDLTLEEVLGQMLRHQWNEVLVTRQRLLRLLSGDVPGSVAVKELCIANPFTTHSDTTLLSARDVMRSHRISSLPVQDDQGDIIGVLNAKDVCNGFSFKLQMLGEHLYAIMENLVEAIQVINCDGTVTVWNRSAEKIFGVSADEIVGQSLSLFFPEHFLMDVVSGNKKYHNFLMEYNPGLFLLCNAVPVRTAEGTLIGAVCTSFDVSHYISLMDMVETATSKIKHLERNIGYAKLEEASLFYTVNPEMKRTLALARKAATTDVPVLLQGENGTGKTLLAYEIYKNSKRANRPFIEVNCSVIPERLFESEMFGYEGKTFVGGNREGQRKKFERANGGTIFLNGIGEMPLELQAKLLQAIQEGRFHRLGGTSAIEMDIRVIAATNRPLAELVEENTFREDLYYRLKVVTLNMPPLRARLDDIPGLIDLFIRELSKIYQRPVANIAPEVLHRMARHNWPGNMQQLRNVVENLLVLMDGDEITLESLIEANAYELLTGAVSPQAEKNFQQATSRPLEELVTRQEKKMILEALQGNNYNKAKAAQSLGIPRTTLYYKMRTLGIEV